MRAADSGPAEAGLGQAREMTDFKATPVATVCGEAFPGNSAAPCSLCRGRFGLVVKTLVSPSEAPGSIPGSSSRLQLPASTAPWRQQ